MKEIVLPPAYVSFVMRVVPLLSKLFEKSICNDYSPGTKSSFPATNSIASGYLAAYGDERALPILLRKIEDRSIGFVEFQELKYAIEALGGEYNEPRDFSTDKDYLAIEAAGLKSLDEPRS